MEIKRIEEKEYFKLLKDANIDIPLYCDKEAIDAYGDVILLGVFNNDNPLAVFLAPINNSGVRRKYRFFPYHMPVILKEENNIKLKEINKALFNYLFKKYDYTFIPLHPDFKVVSAIASQGGFVEMRHTHIFFNKISFEELNSKLKNHIRNAMNAVEIVIDNDTSNYDFSLAIKGNEEEVKLRSNLAKELIKNKKGFVVKAVKEKEVVAGLIIVNDNGWMYLLHSYQKEKIRGVVPLMILKAIEESFDKMNCKCFDFEGSVIDEIDDFFSSFNGTITTYPYVIYAKDKDKFISLIERSINIEGRIKNEEN